MKSYEAPAFALIKLNAEDIITTSIGKLEDLDTSGTEGPLVGVGGFGWNIDNGINDTAGQSKP